MNDNFTGQSLFAAPENNISRNAGLRQFSVTNKSDTRLQLCSSQMLDARREGNGAYATKNKIRYSRIGQKHNLNAEKTIEMEINENVTNSELNATSVNAKNLSEITSDIVCQRKYFLDNQTMQRLQQIILLGVATGSMPWKWNKKTCRIDKWGPRFEKMWRIFWIISTVQNFLIAIFQVRTIWRIIGLVETYRQAFQLSLSVFRSMYNLGMKFFAFYYHDMVSSFS